MHLSSVLVAVLLALSATTIASQCICRDFLLHCCFRCQPRRLHRKHLTYISAEAPQALLQCRCRWRLSATLQLVQKPSVVAESSLPACRCFKSRRLDSVSFQTRIARRGRPSYSASAAPRRQLDHEPLVVTASPLRVGRCSSLENSATVHFICLHCRFRRRLVERQQLFQKPFGEAALSACLWLNLDSSPAFHFMLGRGRHFYSVDCVGAH